jgi:hypothetical protein
MNTEKKTHNNQYFRILQSKEKQLFIYSEHTYERQKLHRTCIDRCSLIVCVLYKLFGR